MYDNFNSDSSSTSERCIICYHNSEVEVTEDQLTKISSTLKVPVTIVDDRKTIKSPFPLREICLEDFGVKNSEINEII